MKNRSSKHLLLLVSAIIFLCSCEKEIMIKHNDKETKLVIEANFNADSAVNVVKLSRTVGVTSGNNFPKVSGAKVHITDGAQYSEYLTESGPGEYKTQHFTGKPGVSYQLTVNYSGKTYVGSCTVPQPVDLDTLTIERFKMVGQDIVSVLPLFLDPAGSSNYYAFVQYLNLKKLKGTTLMSDELSDGKLNMQPILNSDFVLLPGDRYQLEMRSLSKESFDYLFSKNLTANQQSAAPANPITNLNGGALGFFIIYNSANMDIRIAD